MKRTLTSLAIAALALSLAGCGSDDNGDAADSGEFRPIAAGKLTVCSDVPYPPFEDFDKSSPTGFKGFDIDIVTEVAKELDLELVVRDSSFDALKSGLEVNAGNCDLIASAMSILPERQEVMDMSDSYYDSMQSLLVPQGSDIKSIDDLEGKKVGVQKGTTGETYANGEIKDAEIVVFPSDGEMWPALKSNQVDALLQDLPVNLEHEKEGGFTIVEEYETEEAYGLAMAKNSGLLDDVNDALEAMREDGRYQKIYDTYFSAK
ncbi:transporter substrate-binding domain-containing protein [Nocardioides daphniae]|uniref:Basic amino acid ABC transporter substrate-binding protein n=1 Tax=Nocardioides daphniae TaxID=402297 RepID=A0A4P7U9M6_9ACTN|nr:transporter substrate-binding domain-containing protein [Nocardioides daphniae]QCC76750.1 transporter substrate-binding domain-containing protein [Nocardioides daphniae]GGD16005.1 basic amino acid ABC transporter substrate-binding protein [Nocardioides daphniae]